jgi:hypothetical protein
MGSIYCAVCRPRIIPCGAIRLRLLSPYLLRVTVLTCLATHQFGTVDAVGGGVHAIALLIAFAALFKICNIRSADRLNYCVNIVLIQFDSS